MGKRQGMKRVNHALHGRIALAAALWHGLADPRALVLFLAADTHGARRLRDADVVRRLLTTRYGLPLSCIRARPWSRCTVVEVRAVRVLARVHGVGRVMVVTHGYHARRTAAYFAEVGVPVELVVPEPTALASLVVPLELRTPCELAVRCAHPARLDLLRERLVEVAVGALHRSDPRGRAERWLARRFRG